MSDELVLAVIPREYPARSCFDCGYYHPSERCPQRQAVIAIAHGDALKARQRLADLTGEPA